jgi:hypothetical protein
LIDQGISHMHATAILLFVNILFIALTVLFHRLGTSVLLLMEISLMFLFTFFVQRLSQKRRAKEASGG